MKISVRVIPNSSQQGVKENEKSEYRVYVRAKPIKGEANRQARDHLCDYFDLPKHRVALVSGKTSRTKIYEIK